MRLGWRPEVTPEDATGNITCRRPAYVIQLLFSVSQRLTRLSSCIHARRSVRESNPRCSTPYINAPFFLRLQVVTRGRHALEARSPSWQSMGSPPVRIIGTRVVPMPEQLLPSALPAPVTGRVVRPGSEDRDSSHGGSPEGEASDAGRIGILRPTAQISLLAAAIQLRLFAERLHRDTHLWESGRTCIAMQLLRPAASPHPITFPPLDVCVWCDA
jgi:hypothetical protein